MAEDKGQGATAVADPPGSERPAGERTDRGSERKTEKTELQSDRGTTSIADSVVTKVAGMAAREVAGVHALGGGASRALGAVAAKVGMADERSQGVSAEVGERETAIDLTVVVDYGESIPRVASAVRENVIKRVEGLTGLKVGEVNVEVDDLYFGEEDSDDEESRVS
jgi:uncharacterized alkaline shock family protein YloU